MVFSSQIFIFVFLPIALIIYFLIANLLSKFLSQSIKNYILLLLSLLFYCWSGINYITLLLISIFINYICGIIIDNFKNKGTLNKLTLIIGVLFNLLILFYYKYFNFSASIINNIFNSAISLRDIILPLGISFITFQGISYIVDIYRGDAVSNKNPLETALYITFFPKLVSGPIIKYKDFASQLKNRKESLKYFSYGIERIIIGLSKKVIISDILGETVDNIFTLSKSGIDTPTAWIGIICYTLQIYFDFSGYTDTAIGLGSLFGFKFIENFNYPYISKSITEFWRRWHISLSTWFKEYLYIPLGGNRKGKFRTYLNLFIVFFSTGIWHGASFNFIVWGLWHGLFMIIERMIMKKDWYIKIPNFIKLIFTLFIIMIGWVFFRANGLKDAINYLSIMFGLKSFDFITFDYRYLLSTKLIIWVILGVIFSTPFINNILNKFNNNIILEFAQTITLGILFILSIIFIVNSTYSPFIYFQF